MNKRVQKKPFLTRQSKTGKTAKKHLFIGVLVPSILSEYRKKSIKIEKRKING